MKTLLTAAMMLGAASFATLAVGQHSPNPANPRPVETPLPNVDKPVDDSEPAVTTVAPTPDVVANSPAATAAATTTSADAQTMASAAEVAQTRRAYRDQCARGQSREFCECVASGVAQALMPQEVRIAARGARERLSAQGDAGIAAETDATPQGSSSANRIEQVEAHYADACAQFRR